MDEKRPKSTDEMAREQRKWMASSGLFVLLMAVALINYQVLTGGEAKDSRDGRVLASLSSVATADSEWEKWLEQKNTIDRNLASIGRRPSDIDRLTAGLLEGKYLVRFEKGKLKQLQFSDMGDDRPKYIRNRAGFIEQFRELMPEDYVSLKLTEDNITEQKITEVYTLLNGQASPVAQVKFQMDNYGRLLSLVVE